ncbi:MAG: hypothetical protein JWN48_253 [Myxococcaceae bacterium]|nr:hypothetical protein [Myxococcaceae bacterium]
MPAAPLEPIAPVPQPEPNAPIPAPVPVKQSELLPNEPAQVALIPPQPIALTQVLPPSNSDAWVAFEQTRDKHTVRAERWLYPLLLGAEAVAGIALAVASSRDSRAASIAAGIGGGLAGAALLPTMLSSSRSGARAWFGVGTTSFTLGLSAALVATDLQHRHDEADPSYERGRWLGPALALQGLVMLPIGLMPGLPTQQDYDAYWRLPPEARPLAAARILRKVDKFEQRSAALALLGSLASSIVLAAGVTRTQNHAARTELAAWSMIPLGTALLGIVPRMFMSSRTERFVIGEAPRRMALNAW